MTRQEIEAEIKRLRPHAEYDPSVWAEIESLTYKLEEYAKLMTDTYVLALAMSRNDKLPTKYWWGPFTDAEARYEHAKRVDIYETVIIVKEV